MKNKKKGIAGHWKRATGCSALQNMSSCSTGRHRVRAKMTS